MRVFVAVGTQRFPFDRLLRAVDESCLPAEHDVFAQTGHGGYAPRRYLYTPFLREGEFARELAAADLVVCHAGVGCVVGALSAGARVLAVPRLARLGEHVDDHQLEIARAFRDTGHIAVCEDASRLDEAVESALAAEFAPWEPAPCTIEDEIEAFLSGLGKGGVDGLGER